MHQLFCDAKSGLKTLDIKFLIHSLRLREELVGAGVMLDTKELDVQSVFRRIRQESRGKEPYFREFIDLRLEEMLYIIARLTIQSRQEHAETPDEGLVAEPDEDVCQKTIAYIKQHYSEDINLRIMATEVGYNPSYICQMFKKRLQNTPTGYLYGYRLKKAKELIVYSDFSLKQIATLTGFKNIHHFTRTFHNLEGVAPGHWRKLEKEGIGKGVFLKAQFTNKNFLREEKVEP
jgi:YesN/AraC family two-component response regulator